MDKKGTTVITDELIGYDQDANPVCVRDSSTGNLGNRDFTFDGRNRLIKASAPNQTWMSSEYQYDSQDNIKLARLGTRQYNYSQNALNQLASITQPSSTPSAVNYGLGTCADASLTADLGNGSTGPSVAIPGAGTPGTATTGGTQTAKYTFTTDNEGRMTAKGTQAYVYDALNRITQVTGKESYLYDGHGRRVQITKTSDSKINYPLYSLDGKLLVEDNRQTLTRTEYIYAGGRLVAKKIQPITSTGTNNGTVTTTYIHTDFLGSPVAETNASGTVTRVERYTPYGEPSDLQLDVGPGFTGHATDVLTGLTNMQQRYYDAEIGRFLTPDPVGPEEDFINHFNRYNYTQNNPVRYTDPDGRQPFPCPGTRNPASCPGGATNTLPLTKEEKEKKEKPAAPTAPAAGSMGQITGDNRSNVGLKEGDNDSDLGVMEGYISDPQERLRQNAINNTKPIESVCPECIAIPILRAEKLFGPNSGLFGTSHFRGPGNAGILNRTKAIRIGWSYNKKDGRLHFSLRIGKWHSDKYFDPISIKPPPIK